MAIADDWTLNYTTKEISHTAGTTRYTVQEFYSWLMDLFDDSGQMDDPVPMSAQTPREFTIGKDAGGNLTGWAFAADSDYGYLKSGSIVDATNNDIWACFYSIGSLNTGATVYVEQNGSLVSASPGYSSGHIDMLVKVSSGGTPIDSLAVTAYTRVLGDTYDHYEATASATGGYNPIPLASENDANDGGDGATFTGISIQFGTVSKDIGDGSGSVNYDVSIDGNGYSTDQVYAYLKYITREQNSTAIDSPENLTEGRFYQSANASYTQVKKSPFGTYAGGKFFGARGVWLENVSDPNQRELIDAAGTTHTPPNSIVVTVTGLVSGDNVLVAADDGFGSIDKAQYTITGTPGATIQATSSLSSDTPASGTVRVGDTVYDYDSWAGDTITLSAGNNAAGESGNFYIPYIDGISTGTSMSSATMIYSADIDIIARVRKKGILPFQNTGTITDAGLTVSAIRTTDSIVS